MRPLRWQVAVVAAAGLALALETLPAVLRWLWVRRRRPRREVLFFPSQVTCTEALLRSPGATPSDCPCSLPHGESSLSRLLSALLAARVSLELCLFAFSSPQLGRAVQLLHQRGVRVRVVTDCDYMALNGSQIGLLRKADACPGARLQDSVTSVMLSSVAAAPVYVPTDNIGRFSFFHTVSSRPLFHFELIVVYGVRKCPGFFLLHEAAIFPATI
ncbi:mitochondrial cardiolipin hydrolase isoform X2 [Bubalus kerabau]|uniref:mitochondrial cardiolipin hydrolase isoform X2 n=1 Tax=Bubalus carabanensis TaxID=3119969 RepID=UPI00244EAFEA|nr:mitochondrial cardiolipin hydrolase isoform X2 [Bubalus carabanensis]